MMMIVMCNDLMCT